MTLTLVLISTAAVVGLLGLGYVAELPPSPMATVIDKAAAPFRDPDKLGWMDDVPLTEADQKHIAEISGRGMSDNLSVIHSLQAGARGNISRRDFELLRQDRRRAQAAYPDASEDDLYQGTWLSVDIDARVPDSFCKSGNSNGSEVDGKWYLDGGCYVSVVKAQYTQRADVPTTKRVLAELKDAGRQKKLIHLNRWGYSMSLGGTGGSISMNCYPDPLPSSEEEDDRHVPGQCVIIINSEKKYVFPFVASDWINPPWGRDGAEKLASAKGIEAIAYVRAAEKPWVMRDGSLARGQTCPPGRLCRSMWNAEKDDYDNTDIGPSNPASWVADGIFGMALSYVPAPDNGEQRSDPNKPWFIAISYYGSPTQISGGWTEQEAKDLLPKFSTGMSYPVAGQDFESINRGNLREARATQEPSTGLVLKDRAMPVAPAKEPEVASCVQGGMLMPGQSCVMR